MEKNNEKVFIDSDKLLPEAPLTSNQPKPNPMMKYKFGRKVIKIPLTTQSVNEKTIEKYLPKILSLHKYNITDIEHLEDVYVGKSHIWEKVRAFNPDKKNSIVNENHAFYMVEFKKGYMYGNDIQYSVADENMSSDEVRYLNKYMKEQDKASKNINTGESVFKCGNAYRFVLPKIMNVGENLEKVSPFELYNLDSKEAFIVYSSTYTKKKLFGGIITVVDSPNPDEIKYEIMIYDKYYAYRFHCDKYGSSTTGIKFIEKKRHYIGHIPFVEYYTNSSRMGVIELVESILDAVNDISSDSIDNINDFVNSILAIYNMTIDKEAKKSVDENAAIELITTDPNKPADAKYLVNQLQQADVMTRYEILLKVAYNIAGVPQATTKSTSGGDTGEARALGGGWENADIVANQQEEPLKQGEKALLDICLDICKATPNCPVKELYPCDIEINFNRKKNNNLLVKTQSLSTLIAMNMPKEIALNIVGLTANTNEVAKEWENYVNTKEEKANQDKQATDINVQDEM